MTPPEPHRGLNAALARNSGPSAEDVEALAEIIWTTSRADESTISATGANIVARAILASDWLAAHVAQVAAAAEKAAGERIAAAIEADSTRLGADTIHTSRAARIARGERS